jgi:hypothetical protein
MKNAYQGRKLERIFRSLRTLANAPIPAGAGFSGNMGSPV